jgi:hypothetical protein
MHDQRSNGEISERINQLYWESDNTVDSISRELEVGRNALYAALTPLPSGARCLECGADTVFTNRTSRAAGMAVCRSCEERDAMMDGPTTAPDASVNGGDRPQDDTELERWTRWREDLRSVPPQRAAMIGGAAALGLVVGAAAARAIRSR